MDRYYLTVSLEAADVYAAWDLMVEAVAGYDMEVLQCHPDENNQQKEEVLQA